MSAVAVVGAGIAGRCCALALARAGRRVTVFERGALDERGGVSFVAAGMLAPLSEAAAHGGRELYELGKDAVARWSALAASLPRPVFLAAQGSLIAARAQDLPELTELKARFSRVDPAAAVRMLGKDELRRLEPDLAEGVDAGLLVPGEGAVHAGEAMDALAAALRAHADVTVRERAPAEAIQPYAVDGERFGLVVDCRGLAARGELRDLRGVRGELVEITAPELAIARPTRVPHPRYPVYVVPRGGGAYAVGATALESDDAGPPSVTAVLELLGAVYGLSPGFRVAGVTRVAAGVRPAFFDNMPALRAEPGLVRVNGMFRHGFLLGPAMGERVVRLAEGLG